MGWKRRQESVKPDQPWAVGAGGGHTGTITLLSLPWQEFEFSTTKLFLKSKDKIKTFSDNKIKLIKKEERAGRAQIEDGDAIERVREEIWKEQ